MRWSRRDGRQASPGVVPDHGPGWPPWSVPEPVAELERRLPARWHPTYQGAVCFLGLGSGAAGKLYVLTLLLTLILLVGPGLAVVLFLGVLGVTMVAGAVGGTIHGLLRPLDRLGRAGTWLRWLIAIFAALVASAVLAPDGPFNLDDPALYVAALGAAVLGAGGLLLLDDRRPGRPTPRRFEYLLKRDRLWAAADRARARRRPPMPPLRDAVRALPAASPGWAWPYPLHDGGSAVPLVPSPGQ